MQHLSKNRGKYNFTATISTELAKLFNITPAEIPVLAPGDKATAVQIVFTSQKEIRLTEVKTLIVTTCLL